MRHSLFLTGLIAAGSLALSACAGTQGSIGNAGYVPQAPSGFAQHATNAIGNPGFETGKLSPWAPLGQRTGAGTVTNKAWHTGKYSGFMGTTADPAVNGPHGLEQTVTVPSGKPTLSWWHAGTSTDEAKYGYDEVDVYSGATKLGVCYGGAGTSDTGTKLVWKKASCSMSKYAGKKVTLEFYVNDNGYAKAYVNWYVDDVTLM